MTAKLTSRIPQIIPELQAKMEGVVSAGAQAIETSAKGRAPDAPPEGKGLVEAIHVEEEVEGHYVVAGDDDVFYGHFVEYGTVKTSPHPFLLPALEENAPVILASAQRALRGL